MPHVKIESVGDNPEDVRFFVDGVEATGVAEYTVEQKCGGPLKVTLIYAPASIEIVGDASVIESGRPQC